MPPAVLSPGDEHRAPGGGARGHDLRRHRACPGEKKEQLAGASRPDRATALASSNSSGRAVAAPRAWSRCSSGSSGTGQDPRRRPAGQRPRPRSVEGRPGAGREQMGRRDGEEPRPRAQRGPGRPRDPVLRRGRGDLRQARRPCIQTPGTSTRCRRRASCSSGSRSTRAWSSWPPTCARTLTTLPAGRIQTIIEFPTPDDAPAADVAARPVHVEHDLDEADIARLATGSRLSAAAIVQVVLAAVFAAVARDAETTCVTTEDVDSAVRSELERVGLPAPPPLRKVGVSR